MPLRGVKLLRSEILLRRVLDECVCRPGKKVCAYRFDSALWQIVICLCVVWNRVTNSVHQGSLWEGAVSQRLTEGENPGLLDAAS